jgi:hypothetical protein
VISSPWTRWWAAKKESRWNIRKLSAVSVQPTPFPEAESC